MEPDVQKKADSFDKYGFILTEVNFCLFIKKATNKLCIVPSAEAKTITWSSRLNKVD